MLDACPHDDFDSYADCRGCLKSVFASGDANVCKPAAPGKRRSSAALLCRMPLLLLGGCLVTVILMFTLALSSPRHADKFKHYCCQYFTPINANVQCTES